MTRREAAILSAYTGVLIGEIVYLQTYLEEKLGEPISINDLSNLNLTQEQRDKIKNDFFGLSYSII